MLLKNKLLKNGFYYIVGTFLIQGVSFFTMPIFTRILSIENYGIISLYNTWLSIFIILFSFQSHGIIPMAKLEYSKEEFKDYHSNIYLLIIFIALFLGGGLIAFKETFSNILSLDPFSLLCLILQSFAMGIINIKMSIYVFDERPKEKLLVSFILIVINVLLSIYFIRKVEYFSNYKGRILGNVIPTFIIAFFFLFSTFKVKKPKINPIYWKFSLGLSIPLIFHGLSNVVMSGSDKIFIEKYRDFSEVGLYNLSYTLGLVINILWVAFNNAWVPWYHKNLKTNNNLLIFKYSKYYLKIFSAICIGYLMIIPEVIKIMAPPKYYSGLYILPLIIASYFFVFLYSFSVNYEFYAKKTKYIGLATTGASLINIILNIIFVPKYGYIAAASTTLVSYFFMFLFHEFITRKLFKYNILNLKDYIIHTSILLFFILIYYFYLSNILIRYLFLLAYFFILILSFYKKNKIDFQTYS